MVREDYAQSIEIGELVELTTAESYQLVADEQAHALDREDYIANRQYKDQRAKGVRDDAGVMVTPGYTSISDQLDMQYWDAVNGTTTWKDYVASVKAAHPKGDN